MYCTEDIELTRSIKWSNTGTTSTNVHIRDGRRSRLHRKLGRTAYPLPVCNYMQNLNIINKRNFRTFRNIDTFLHKVGCIHVNSSARAASPTTSATTAGRCWSTSRGSCDSAWT